jgi:glutathione S-transferase
MKLYGDKGSGNCQKVKITADFLKIPYRWIDIDIMKAESRTEDFLRKSPMGQVPMIELDDGRCLAQSNAIIRYLALGSPLLPADPFTQARIDELLFWEQYSHEPYVATSRFHMAYLGRS